MYLSKDFIETAEGLVFAVVEQGTERGRVLCFLRYVRQGTTWKKYSTRQANAFLQQAYPQYLYYSTLKAAHLHAVPVAAIVRHHQPRQRLRALLQQPETDRVERDLQQLCALYRERGLDIRAFGVTGSLLIGAQTSHSDIDLVVYGRDHFIQTRELTRRLIAQHALQNLHQQAWLTTYRRRSCELTLEEYIWHERRKYNKALINGRKFDLSLIVIRRAAKPVQYKKHGKLTIRAVVIDDRFAYDYPAKFILDHASVRECVCYTATYSGQALAGESVEIRGFLEISEQEGTRIVVGSSREAEDEYIKVLR